MRPCGRGTSVIAIGAVLLAATSACGDRGPTVEEAGKQLAADGNALVNGSRIMWPPIAITQAADENIPCGKGKAKRVFAATANFAPNTVPENNITIDDNGIMGYMERREYTPDIKASQRLSNTMRTVVIQRTKRPKITFRIQLQLPRPNFRVNGETDCLRNS